MGYIYYNMAHSLPSILVIRLGSRDMVVYDMVGLENLWTQLVFSLAEGFSIVSAFLTGYALVDYLHKKISYETGTLTLLIFIVGFFVSLIIFLPIHFTIGV